LACGFVEYGIEQQIYEEGMPTDRRVARVAEMIKREVSQMLLTEIKDDRVGTGMVSVTDVDVSGDLQHAKIFVSVYGTDQARAETMAGLKSATGFVRSALGRRIRLRRTPEVVFIEDRSLERGTQMLSLLNRLSEERQAAGLEDETLRDADEDEVWLEADSTVAEDPIDE
jgi:ribosome-binding factor A